MMKLLHSIPFSLVPDAKHRIMKRNFGVDVKEYNELFQQLTENYQKTFGQLLGEYTKRRYSFRFLPTDLLLPSDKIF